VPEKTEWVPLKEEWRDISGYENVYKVSDRGKVKKLRQRGERGWKYKRAMLLRQTRSDNGRRTVVLYRGGGSKGKAVTVSRLVAIAFLPNPQNYNYVRHKDGNKRNNWVFNLEWIKTANLPKEMKQTVNPKKKLTTEERSQLPGFRWPTSELPKRKR